MGGRCDAVVSRYVVVREVDWHCTTIAAREAGERENAEPEELSMTGTRDTEARRTMIETKAAQFGAQTAVERDAYRALVAYEQEILSVRNGRTTYASRTRQMIDRYGILPTIERLVTRNTDASGYTAVAEAGMLDLSWEAVVLRYPESF